MASNFNFNFNTNNRLQQQQEVQPSTSAQANASAVAASAAEQTFYISEEEFSRLNAEYRAYLIGSTALFSKINHVYLHILHAFGYSDHLEPTPSLFSLNVTIDHDQDRLVERLLIKFYKFFIVEVAKMINGRQKNDFIENASYELEKLTLSVMKRRPVIFSRMTMFSSFFI